MVTSKRRTQTERTEQTRAALINATVEILMKHGMQGATVQEICKLARVTTGAIQHHFGSKNGLIVEVVRTLFTPFTDSIRLHDKPGLTLEERVDKMIAHYWALYGDDRYFAVVEAVLGARHDPELMQVVQGYRSQQIETLDSALRAEFADVELPPAQMRNSVHRVMDYLRGHALRRLLQSDATPDNAAISHARDMMLRDFSALGADTQRARG